LIGARERLRALTAYPHSSLPLPYRIEHGGTLQAIRFSC
jgi:hypothetical protein